MIWANFGLRTGADPITVVERGIPSASASSGVMWIIGIASPEVHQLETVLVDKLEARIQQGILATNPGGGVFRMAPCPVSSRRCGADNRGREGMPEPCCLLPQMLPQHPISRHCRHAANDAQEADAGALNTKRV